MFNSHSFVIREMRPKRRKTFISVILLGLLILIFLFGFLVFGSDVKVPQTLSQIHVLFRHGERTPSSSYPTDPFIQYKWSDGLGALTNKGKQSLFKLGKTLKLRYKSFLNEYYLPEELSVKSSYNPRCQMSVMTLLAGLYPPVGHQVWNEYLLWQPIPVNPIPRQIDNLIAAKAPCKAFKIEKDKSDKELHGNLTEKELKLFKYLSEKTNLLVSNIEQVEQIYSILKIEDENGLNIPEWTQSVFPEPLKTLAGMNLASYTRTPKLKRLQGGPLLKEWLENMRSSKKKIHLYSGHDLTLVNLMRTIGVTTSDTFLPDYGAAFILEVHHISNKEIVKAFYYNSSRDSEPINLVLPNGEPISSLETLNDLVEPYLPSDWNQECEMEV